MGTKLMYSDNGSLVLQQLSWNHATFRTELEYMGSNRLNCQLLVYIEVSLVMRLDNANTYVAINVMPNPPQVGVGRGTVGGLTQNLGPRGRNFAPN